MFKKEIKKTNKAKNNRIICLNNTFYCKEHTLFNHQLHKRKLFPPGCTCTLHTNNYAGSVRGKTRTKTHPAPVDTEIFAWLDCISRIVWKYFFVQQWYSDQYLSSHTLWHWAVALNASRYKSCLQKNKKKQKKQTKTIQSLAEGIAFTHCFLGLQQWRESQFISIHQTLTSISLEFQW